MSDGTLYIELMDIDEIQFADLNPKEHDIGELHESVNRFGAMEPPMIDEATGKLIVGHGRVTTYRQKKAMGEAPPIDIEVRGDRWYCPVIRGSSFDDPITALAYLIADNFLTESMGWRPKELREVLATIRDNSDLELRGTGFDNEYLELLYKDAINPREPNDSGKGIEYVIIKLRCNENYFSEVWQAVGDMLAENPQWHVAMEE